MNSGERRTSKGMVEGEGVTHGVQHVHPSRSGPLDPSLGGVVQQQPQASLLPGRSLREPACASRRHRLTGRGQPAGAEVGVGAVDQQGDLEGEIQFLGAQPGADPTAHGRPWLGSMARSPPGQPLKPASGRLWLVLLVVVAGPGLQQAALTLDIWLQVGDPDQLDRLDR